MIVDTSALIELFNRKELDRIVGEKLPLFVLIEFLRGFDADKAEEIKNILEKLFTIVPVDNKVILKYIEIYRKLKNKGRMIGDVDLLIASMAITHDEPLFTRDIKHFLRLKCFGLKLTEV